MDRPLLVATLTEAPSPDGEELRRLSGVADWLEVRADRLGDLDPAWLRERFAGELLYTLRSRAEGGEFAASAERRRQRIVEGSKGYDRVDLEGERDLAPALLGVIEPARRVVSWHGAAPDLASLASRVGHLSGTPAAHYKLVPRAAASGDELVPLALLAELRRSDVTAFAGGEIGTWTRAVAPRFGAPLVYGSVGGRAAAPGQLPIERMIRDWGLPEAPPISRLFGVVGDPALGSLSPRLHNAACRALGIDALYVPFQVEHFGDFWLEIVEGDLLPRLGLPLTGLSVTAPYKEVAFAVAGAASPLANRLQAANTLTFRRGVWEAESTDGEGLMQALSGRGVEPRGRRAAVVGCGGAGRAAALALDHAGAEVVVVNRSVERGQLAARSLGLPFVAAVELDVSRFDLLVQATPLGRAAGDPPAFPLDELAPGTVVVDLVYGERPTRLLEQVAERDGIAVDGREVLLHQAIAQFRIFTGHELPLELGRRVLELEQSP